MRAAAVLLIAAVSAGWAGWLVAAPALAAAPQSRAVVWAEALTYRAGAIICHQQAARSLHVGGVRMPVCARCFGLYGGGSIGAVLAAAWLFLRRRSAGGSLGLPLSRCRWAAVACALPTLAAWAGEHLGGLAVTGETRAILAIPLGAAVAAIVTLWAGGAAFYDTAAASALDL
jgi:hypothetical protein